VVEVDGEEGQFAVSVGDELQGMEVVSIETERIELRSGERLEELSMHP
jgi:hypothetical protein